MRWIFIIGGVIAFMVLGRFALSFINPPDIDLSNIDADRAAWRESILACTANDIRAVFEADIAEAAMEADPDMTEVPAQITAAADAGDTDAMVAIAAIRWDMIIDSDTNEQHQELARLLAQGTATGSSYALRHRGLAFAEGRYSYASDGFSAYRDFQAAIAAGDVASHYHIADLFREGLIQPSGRDPRDYQQIIWDRWLLGAAGCHAASLNALAYNMERESEPFYEPDFAARIRTELTASGVPH